LVRGLTRTSAPGARRVLDAGFGVVFVVSGFGLDDAKYLAAVVSSPSTSVRTLVLGQQRKTCCGSTSTTHAAFLRGVDLVGFLVLQRLLDIDNSGWHYYMHLLDNLVFIAIFNDFAPFYNQLEHQIIMEGMVECTHYPGSFLSLPPSWLQASAGEHRPWKRRSCECPAWRRCGGCCCEFN
jgi:hypothetical protein